MKVGIIIVAGMIVLFTTACSQKAEPVSCMPKSDVAAMRALKPESAKSDAARDSNNGDHRLLGVHSGVGLLVPGLNTDPYASGYGLRVVEGTDTPCSAEESELNAITLRYAKSYNKEKMLLRQPPTT